MVPEGAAHFNVRCNHRGEGVYYVELIADGELVGESVIRITPPADPRILGPSPSASVN